MALFKVSKCSLHQLWLHALVCSCLLQQLDALIQALSIRRGGLVGCHCSHLCCSWACTTWNKAFRSGQWNADQSGLERCPKVCLVLHKPCGGPSTLLKPRSQPRSVFGVPQRVPVASQHHIAHPTRVLQGGGGDSAHLQQLEASHAVG